MSDEQKFGHSSEERDRWRRKVTRIMRGVDYAIMVLKTQPKRYDFSNVRIPKGRECGCLVGLIGQGARITAPNHETLNATGNASILEVSRYLKCPVARFYMALYQAMDDATGGPDQPWRFDAALAARYLRRATKRALKECGL